jgi:ubiquitination network signaling protein AcrB
MREIEISRPSSKASSIAGDEVPDILSVGEGHIRIIHVDCSSIKFEAIHLNPGLDDQEAGPSIHHDSLFVRINGAYWTSTCMSISRTDQAGTVCTGEISGLAPNCTYTCSFNRDDGQQIAVITVKTPALLDKDQVSSMSSLSTLPFRHTQRPSSPTTTIRQSITTNEAKLSDTKARVSRTRRSHKAALSKVEKEVESFSSRLKSSSDDTKQRQKLLQAERTMKQNEDATQSVSAALDDLSSIPEEEVDGYSSRKDAFERKRALLAAANESLSSATSTADSELANLTEELKATNRQRERLLARQTRLIEQQERITQANLQGLNEKERKAEETLAKEQDHARIEAEYTNQFAIFHRELASLCMRLQQAKQESQVLENQMINQQHNSIIGSGPLTPEGNLPGTNSISRPPQPAFGHGFPTNHTMTTLAGPGFPEPAHISPFLPYSKPLAFQPDPHPNFNSNRARSASNRSGGALSNYSADFEDADPIPPMPGVKKFIAEPRRTGSGGSPAGAGAGAGAAGSVSPTVAAKVGVVGLGGSLRTNANVNAKANANATMSRRESPGQGIW